MEMYVIIMQLFLITFILCYTVYRDTTKLNRQFNIQLEASKVRSKPEIHRMSYEDLMKIVNNVITYYTSKNLEVHSYANKSTEEISIIIDDLTTDIATLVLTSISPTIIHCLKEYVSEDFINRYIFNNVKLSIVVNINNRKQTVKMQKTLANQQHQQQQSK